MADRLSTRECKTLITLANISKNFGTFEALKNVNLEVQDSQFLAPLTPAGYAKTSLSRIIAGLAFPDAGQMSVHHEDVTNLKVAEGKVGFVFQLFAFYEHIRITDHVEFGLSVRPRSQ